MRIVEDLRTHCGTGWFAVDGLHGRHAGLCGQVLGITGNVG